VPSWSRPVKKVVGSASDIKQDIPPPEATGFSCSVILLLDAADNARPLVGVPAVSFPRVSSGGLLVSSPPGTEGPRTDCLWGIGPTALGSKAGARGVTGVVGCGVGVEDVVAVEVEENGERTEPNTRLAVSREASFPTSMLNREGFLGFFGGGRGRNSRGM